MKHKRSTESLEAVYTHTPRFTKSGLIYCAKNVVGQYTYANIEVKEQVKRINKKIMHNNINKKLDYIVEVNNCKKMKKTIKRIKLLQDSLAFL